MSDRYEKLKLVLDKCPLQQGPGKKWYWFFPDEDGDVRGPYCSVLPNDLRSLMEATNPSWGYGDNFLLYDTKEEALHALCAAVTNDLEEDINRSYEGPRGDAHHLHLENRRLRTELREMADEIAADVLRSRDRIVATVRSYLVACSRLAASQELLASASPDYDANIHLLNLQSYDVDYRRLKKIAHEGE